MDENKNQNQQDDLDIREEKDYSNAVPNWMTGSTEEESDDEESLGHESLTEDQDIDIDEYDEAEQNPVGDNDEDEEEGEEDEEEEEEEDEGEESIYDEEEEDEIEDSDNVVMSKSKVLLIKKLLSNIKENNDKLNQLIGGFISEEDEARINIAETSEGLIQGEEDDDVSKVVEGVFDGENMIGPDGKQYNVPPNYASKSKLVEGDLLKLTITQKGTFVYKQIKPIERERIIGTLEKAADGSHLVSSGSKHWKILTASVTYFKGEPGDEAVILVPRAGDSKWAAVENIIKSK